ncbi:MAG: hypothetical protein AAB603_00635 [Patescibacteria group bacterium]
MIIWIIIWLFFWISSMGLINYLFKKHKITYYKKSWQHTLFFIILSIILFVVYQNQFLIYFDDLSFYHLMVVLFLFILWLFVPILYKNDYYAKKERFGYQLPKFFEILFQDVCFLGGLLTFGISPVIFGLVFFIVHIPGVFLLPKKFALLPIISSLFGGLIFAYLQSQGILRFLTALFIHLSFWASFHYALSKKHFLGITPLKR